MYFPKKILNTVPEGSLQCSEAAMEGGVREETGVQARIVPPRKKVQ